MTCSCRSPTGPTASTSSEDAALNSSRRAHARAPAHLLPRAWIRRCSSVLVPPRDGLGRARKDAHVCAVAPAPMASSFVADRLARVSVADQLSEIGVTCSPGMRSKWRVLAVPMRHPLDIAVAATIRSCAPTSVPDEAR